MPSTVDWVPESFPALVHGSCDCETRAAGVTDKGAAARFLLAALGAVTLSSLLAAIIHNWHLPRRRVNSRLEFAHLIELSGGGTHLSLGSLLLWAAAQRH